MKRVLALPRFSLETGAITALMLPLCVALMTTDVRAGMQRVDTSNQAKAERVIDYDISDSVRYSTNRGDEAAQRGQELEVAQQRGESQGAQQRRESQGAQERRASQGAQERRESQGTQARRESQGASERRTGRSSER